jgi:dihydroorotate dehydrogenase
MVSDTDPETTDSGASGCPEAAYLAAMYDSLRPLLFRLPPETAHALAARAGALGQKGAAGFIRDRLGWEDNRLALKVIGHSFPNPVGLAAGFDKNARLVPLWEQIGFGFCEVGSITARASAGNPKPRLFRLEEDRALVNRMGLGNEGAAIVSRRLRTLQHDRPVGANLAKTHDPAILGEAALEDFRTSFERVAGLVDYIAINVSCPNTAEGKTFEEPRALEALLRVLTAQRDEMGLEVPLLLKLSPPESDRMAFDSRYDEIVALAETYGVTGFIAANTASDRAGLTADPGTLDAIGSGGMSGPPVAARATQLVRYLYHRTRGERPIIGLGGVDSAEAAYEKIRAGASLVQLYTGLVYGGPTLVRDIKQGLVRLLEADGLRNIREAIGANV